MDMHHIDNIFNEMIDDIAYIRMETFFTKFDREKKKKIYSKS